MSVKGFEECLGPCRGDVTTDYRWYKINKEDKALLRADSWKTISKCCIGNCSPLSVAGMPQLVSPTSVAMLPFSLNVDWLELVFSLLG